MDRWENLSDSALLAFYRKLERTVRVIVEMQPAIIAEAASRLVRNVEYTITRSANDPDGRSRVYIKLNEPIRYCTLAYGPRAKAFGHFMGETSEICVVSVPGSDVPMSMPAMTAVIAVGNRDILVDAFRMRSGAESYETSKGELDQRAYIINEFEGVHPLSQVMYALGYDTPDSAIADEEAFAKARLN